MKKNKLLISLYFVFVFLLCTTTYVGFSGDVEGNAVKVSSITPEYDESSSVVVNNNDVVFNDKNQEVKYKVVLENTEGHSLNVNSIDLTTPTESFLSYAIENLKKDDVIKGNSKKEIIVSLKTKAVEGWGRNFDDELTANVSFAKKVYSGNQNVGSPETGDGVVLAVLIAATSASGLAILLISKNKFAKYMILTLTLSSALTLVKADTTIQLPITINASFESQNVMKANGCSTGACVDYWFDAGLIANFYIRNELTNMDDFNVYQSYDVSAAGNERVMAYMVVNDSNSSYYDLYLQADGIIYANEDASNYFAGMDYLNKIENIEGLDVSNVTNMSEMFAGTGYHSTLFQLDLGDKFNTSNVTDMNRMFSQTGYRNEAFTLDLGEKFDTSKVINMEFMFNRTGHDSTIFKLDLGNKFDTSSVTSMRGMFKSTGYSSYVFTLDLGDKFDTSNVTNMVEMFSYTGSRSKDFTLDLGDKFDTSKVTSMYYMFEETGKSNEAFTLDLEDKFDTSNVTNMSGMFYSTGLNSEVFTLNLGDKFDTAKVTDMSMMFKQTGNKSTKLNFAITIKNPGVTEYRSMFYSVAKKEGAKIRVNYTSETEDLVNNMLATKDIDAHVEKGNLIVDVDNLSIGDEIHISGEKFNVISQTEDTITMFAKYTLEHYFKQSDQANYLQFSDNEDWEYTLDLKDIDIQNWSTNPKTYVNEYVKFLREETGDTSLSGNLITLMELKNLECSITDDYSNLSYDTCDTSPHKNWIINQPYWTRSVDLAHPNKIWLMSPFGSLLLEKANATVGIRPTITISKEALKNCIKA